MGSAGNDAGKERGFHKKARFIEASVAFSEMEGFGKAGLSPFFCFSYAVFCASQNWFHFPFSIADICFSLPMALDGFSGCKRRIF